MLRLSNALPGTCSSDAVAAAELFAEPGDLGFSRLERFLGRKQPFARVQPVWPVAENLQRGAGCEPA
jgi:hypothetical protein